MTSNKALEAALIAVCSELEVIKRLATTGTAESFLKTDDETKRYVFALATEESQRRKVAEEEIPWLLKELDEKNAEIATLHKMLVESRAWLVAALGIVDGGGPPNWDGIREHIAAVSKAGD